MNPCKDCEERTQDCHSYCERWKKWEIKHKIEKARERKFKIQTEQYFPPKRRK